MSIDNVPIDRTYAFLAEHTQALIVWQEMVLHALHEIDSNPGRPYFTVLLDRPEPAGNVQVTFLKVPKA